MKFSREQKRACLQREITQRERVYPRLTESRRMSEAKAAYEIAVMKAILAEDFPEQPPDQGSLL